MVDWNDIKNAFDREQIKTIKTFVANEQNLLESIAEYIAAKTGLSSVQAYNTEEILAFLELPADDIKETLGEPWTQVRTSDMETMIYSLAKKVRKSTAFLG